MGADLMRNSDDKRSSTTMVLVEVNKRRTLRFLICTIDRQFSYWDLRHKHVEENLDPGHALMNSIL